MCCLRSGDSGIEKEAMHIARLIEEANKKQDRLGEADGKSAGSKTESVDTFSKKLDKNIQER